MNQDGRCPAMKEVAGVQRHCQLMVNHGGAHSADWRSELKDRVFRGETVTERSGIMWYEPSGEVV